MVGKLADLVIDPTTRRVTHLVVEPDLQPAFAGPRLVPVELVDTRDEASELTLHCTIEQIRKLESVREIAYLRVGAFPVDDPNWDVGVSEVLALPYYGLGEVYGPPDPSDLEMTYDRIPKGEVEIRRSSLVTSTDGHDLGRVEAFIVDGESKATHFVLERGHLWGRRDIAIPIGAVAEIKTDEVTVGLTKEEVGALPAVRVKRW
jgi:sporulation protein YlmC with PRC-barrel domain